MKWMKRAFVCATALSCSGCGGNVMGSALEASSIPEGAVLAPQTYYLPKGEIPITITWDQAEGSFEYATDYQSVSVADRRWGAFRIWHRHKGLSDEEATVAVDPSTMLLSKASSTYTPQAAQALDQTAALITQAVTLREVLANKGGSAFSGSGKDSPPPDTVKCKGVKLSGRIPIAPGRAQSVSLLPIKAIEGCEIFLQATVTPIDKTERDDGRKIVKSAAEMLAACAAAVCFRLPRIYEVKLAVSTSPRSDAPTIPPFTVVAPDLETVAVVPFPTGSFATKSVSLEMTNGMLASYSVKNASVAVGVLTVATSALVAATAVAEIN